MPFSSLLPLLLSLCLSLPPLLSASSSSSGPGYPTITLPPGTVAQVSQFLFSDLNDGMGCLSSSADFSLGFAASDGGDIYVWPLQSKPLTISPLYVAGTGSAGASFAACQANPSGTLLYLLDTRGILLYSYAVATPSLAPVVVATFPGELIGSLTSLAVDFASSIAYVGTRETQNIYSVNVSLSGQSISSYYATPAQSDVSALFLSPDASTLYYGAPAPAQGEPGSINALSVAAGAIANADTPTVLVESLALIFPDSLYLNASQTASANATLYIKDGGPFHGEAEPNEDPDAYQSVFVLPIRGGPPNASASLPALLRTNELNLPGGIMGSGDGRFLLFTSTSSLNSLSLFPQVVPVPSSSTFPPSSSRFSSSPTSAFLHSSSITSTVPAGLPTAPLPTTTPSPTASASSLPPTPLNPSSDSSDSSLSTGAIIGIAVGGAVLVLLLFLAALCCRFRRPRDSQHVGVRDIETASDDSPMARTRHTKATAVEMPKRHRGSR